MCFPLIQQHQEEAPEKTLDPKTLKRLAQNREAAKKSRLRKKEHMQQLESSKIKLAQLEQDLLIAQSQGIFSHGTGPGGNLSSGASKFDMEYARWLDNGHKRMSELRGALQRQLLDSDLRVIVDEWHTHYDEIFPLKSVVAKSDVFHLITGVWTNPAERFFLWMGGFRPSEMLKILIPYLDPLTEQQLGDICNLQQSSQQTEEMLSKRLDQLHQSLATTVVGESLSYKEFDRDYMDLMSVAVEKLTDIEQFVIQADMLRQQMLHQMRRILTIRQAARCFLAIGEYHSRLRTVSTLWSSRPRE
ncbi:putative Transcription factor [Zostera marina]|uniref:Putative Transcription factor n=1 Tax=Zostera marina TaxID=29655 RepID=A0A0K9NTY0_ZOSMR|nr:putative Transcription factor [Zostera marina]